MPRVGAARPWEATKSAPPSPPSTSQSGTARVADGPAEARHPAARGPVHQGQQAQQRQPGAEADEGGERGRPGAGPQRDGQLAVQVGLQRDERAAAQHQRQRDQPARSVLGAAGAARRVGRHRSRCTHGICSSVRTSSSAHRCVDACPTMLPDRGRPAQPPPGRGRSPAPRSRANRSSRSPTRSASGAGRSARANQATCSLSALVRGSASSGASAATPTSQCTRQRPKAPASACRSRSRAPSAGVASRSRSPRPPPAGPPPPRRGPRPRGARRAGPRTGPCGGSRARSAGGRGTGRSSWP